MKSPALLPVFAATLFLSAFLIFAVQPMASKMLLPLLGGSPSVWNTAMVFFQAMLLAGYGYAHFIARFLPLKIQAILHIALMCLFTMVLPLAIPKDAMPPGGDGQELWQLGIMLTCIGGPFFILAASAPLFQHWFASSGHKDAENPYFLYAVSNMGSMLALLGYPLLFEPLLSLSEQTQSWYGGYIGLITLVAVCGFVVRNGIKPRHASDNTHVTWSSRTLWIILSFIPSSLMLGVTTMITTDIASAPLFWIIPLTIYLATFIIAFAKKPVNLPLIRELTAYLLCLIILFFMLGGFVALKIVMIVAHLVTFFMCALLCHGELAKSKPAPSHLTEYFLLISFGGVLGGIFNALLAPKIFTVPFEYSLSLAMVAFVIWVRSAGTFKKPQAREWAMIAGGVALCLATYFIKTNFIQVIGCIVIFGFLFATIQRRVVFAAVGLIALLCFQSSVWSTNKNIIARDRNYFGIIKIFEQKGIHFLYHGTTLHGAQWQGEDGRLIPTTYYSPEGPAGDVFNALSHNKGKQDVAVIGLGVGSVACYKAPGRHFDFYEIDQDIARFAEDPRYFSYLSNCKSPYKIILGDGRLKIAAQSKKYDMIMIDAFSSDNIPIHLMTKEAMALYIDRLKPRGLITMNISNRYLDLRPVLAAIGKDLGYEVYFKVHKPKTEIGTVSELFTNSIFAVMARNEADLAAFKESDGWERQKTQTGIRPWTDDYANILHSFIMLQ